MSLEHVAADRSRSCRIMEMRSLIPAVSFLWLYRHIPSICAIFSQSCGSFLIGCLSRNLFKLVSYNVFALPPLWKYRVNRSKYRSILSSGRAVIRNYYRSSFVLHATIISLLEVLHTEATHTDTRYAKLSTVIIPDTANVIFGGECLPVDIIEFLFVTKKSVNLCPFCRI